LSSSFLQKILDITASKALDSPDLVTRQFTATDHSVDRHWRKLQQLSELPNGIKLELGIVS
jgi:hypothetical protein